MPNPESKRNALPYICIGVPIAMVIAGWVAPPGTNYIITFGVLGIFLIALGVQVSNRPLGILINHRNLMSLSRFQTVLWTLIILPAYFTMAIVRIKAWLALAFGVHINFELHGPNQWNDPNGIFGAAPAQGTSWFADFWMGAWDADALCGFTKGAVKIG